jgi:hypothetical protein
LPYFVLLIWFVPVGVLHGYAEATLLEFLPTMLVPISVACCAANGGIIVARLNVNPVLRYVMSAGLLALVIVHSLVYDVERILRWTLAVPLGMFMLWVYLRQMRRLYGETPSSLEPAAGRGRPKSRG